MKVIRIIFLVFFLVFANGYVVQADTPDPPKPNMTGKTASTEAEDDGPGLPGMPIDQDLVFLMMAGLVLGTVFIYRNKTKKASM